MIVLKTTQDKLLAALQSVAGIVERRHTLPVLANVLLRKTGPSIQLTTSDLEIQIRTQAELGGDAGSFATTVGARKLIDILRTLPPDQTVSLEAQQSKLILKGGKSKFTLQTLPAEDFPLVQEAPSFGPAFSVPQKTLKALLGQVAFAMAVHDIRYYLNGILFVAEGKQLSLVATDGHRLAFAHATLEVEVPKQEVMAAKIKACVETIDTPPRFSRLKICSFPRHPTTFSCPPTTPWNCPCLISTERQETRNPPRKATRPGPNSMVASPILSWDCRCYCWDCRCCCWCTGNGAAT